MKKILSIFLLASLVFGISKDEIKTSVETKTAQAIAVLTDQNLDKNTKANSLFSIFDPLFDYKQMAKISLGKKYNALSPDEQNKFDTAFEQKLKNSYIDKLLSYTNQQILIKELSQPQPKRIFLKSELISDGKVYDFVYKFYSKNDDWFIYDIEILGVSVIQTYRSQFADMLDNANFDSLLKKLNETTAIKVDN
ncbi:MAG: ABC transporter substrate-binding protein [Campylobacter sp.]|nr:ABC transporter substrate-binding protein [Campylobacter sp.]